MIKEYGEKKTEEILFEMMKEPPLTIRCNPSKIERKKVI